MKSFKPTQPRSGDFNAWILVYCSVACCRQFTQKEYLWRMLYTWSARISLFILLYILESTSLCQPKGERRKNLLSKLCSTENLPVTRSKITTGPRDFWPGKNPSILSILAGLGWKILVHFWKELLVGKMKPSVFSKGEKKSAQL